MNKTRLTISFLVLTLSLFLFHLPNLSQEEVGVCPIKRISLYDLQVTVPAPGAAAALSTNDWLKLFLVSRGVRDRLLREDPEEQSLEFSDFQLAGHLDADDAKDYPEGPPTNLAPPGAIYDTDYIVTGTVYQTNPIEVKVSLQAAVTREFVGDVVALVDVQGPYDSGMQAAAELSPVVQKILGFQNKKRNESPKYAVYPNMSIKPFKQTIKTQESVKVTIQMNDCDGKTYRGRSIKLSSTLGQFMPQVVTTDENGKTEATFTAGKTPGWAQLTSDYEWKYPSGHGPYQLSQGATIAVEQRPVDIWIVTATVIQNVRRRAKKRYKLAEVTISADHPLIKAGTHKIRKQNMMHSTFNGRATLHLVIRADTSDGDFIYSGEKPLTIMVSGNVSQRDKEEKIEYISKYIAEFSSKRQDNYNGVCQDGSFEFHYTPDYQHVSVYAGSKGLLQTKIERFQDERWQSDPYTLKHSIGINASWSSGDPGGSITRTKSGYSFFYQNTETEKRESSDFGTIITITKTTLTGSIKPFSKR
jgi:hypothetical protein